LSTHAPIHPDRRLRRAAALAVAVAGLAFGAAPALAGSGGTGTGVSSTPVPGAKAKVVNGLAVAPKQAPERVARVIAAANQIAKGHPYCWGGGHASFQSKCYDCSGSVSYALHGGGLLSVPHAQNFVRWGQAGKGSWITVYANSGHVFMTVAGLRFDTSDTAGQGPGWAKGMGYENPGAFTIRHKAGL
jgi:hypothetical protein